MSYKKESIHSYQMLPPPPETITQSQSKPQKPSYLPITSKLSIVIFRKRLYIKSIIDRYQYLRMFIFGIMMTAYTQQNHRDLIDIVKRIIEGGISHYDNSSRLSKLIKKIDSIPEDKGIETQNAVMQLFTESTDSFIINSFIEFMQNQGSQYFRMQECRTWFQSQFRQKIRILDNYSSNKSGITFFRDGDTLIYQSQNDIDNIQGMSLSSNLLTKSQLTNTQFRTGSHQRDNQILELSIMKPSLHNVSQSNGSPLMRHKDSTNSNYSPKPSAFDIEDENKLKKDKEKGFDIWDYLCC